MWWYRRAPFGARMARHTRASVAVLVLMVAAPALLSLGACGFEPVYGKASQVRHAELATIEVSPIRERVGQLVRNHLIDRFGSSTKAARYRLDVTLRETQAELAVQADDKVTRFNLALNAAFNLVEIESQRSLYSSTARSVSSYNIVDSEFATVSSQKNVRNRVAEDVAESIRDLLIIYFARDYQADATP